MRTHWGTKPIIRELDLEPKVMLQQTDSQLSALVSASQPWAAVISYLNSPDSGFIMEIQLSIESQTAQFVRYNSILVPAVATHVLFGKVSRLQREGCKVDVIFVKIPGVFHVSVFIKRHPG